MFSFWKLVTSSSISGPSCDDETRTARTRPRSRGLAPDADGGCPGGSTDAGVVTSRASRLRGARSMQNPAGLQCRAWRVLLHRSRRGRRWRSPQTWAVVVVGRGAHRIPRRFLSSGVSSCPGHRVSSALQRNINQARGDRRGRHREEPASRVRSARSTSVLPASVGRVSSPRAPATSRACFGELRSRTAGVFSGALRELDDLPEGRRPGWRGRPVSCGRFDVGLLRGLR